MTKYSFKIIARNINTFSKKKVDQIFWRKQVAQRLIDFFYCKVDHVINQCKDMEDDLLQTFPSLKGKTSVIHNPVNKIIEDAIKNIDFLKIEQENYLLCVGRLEIQKAFHYAIKAFAEVAKTYKDLRLKIVGQGSLSSQLQQLAKELKVDDRIDFEGFQKDIIRYYLHAKAVLLTSEYEGFPNVLIESIALGTPVVAFDCKSGPKEIIKNGINGFLVNHLDQKHLNEKINEVLSNDWNIEEILETSRSFQSNIIIKRYIDVISQHDK